MVFGHLRRICRWRLLRAVNISRDCATDPLPLIVVQTRGRDVTDAAEGAAETADVVVAKLIGDFADRQALVLDRKSVV